jgi:hypothetical protein
MKKQITHLMKTIPLLLFMLVILQVNAQRKYMPVSPAGPSDFNYTMANDILVDSRNLEFDLYLLDADVTEAFELAAIQAGILIDAGIINGGTITMSIVAGSSQLNASQQPTSVTFTAPNIIKLAGKSPPGAGSGTIISQTAPGTRICRLHMTNTVDFTSGSKVTCTFNFTTTPYPTKVYQYLGGINTGITCTSVNCFSNLGNKYLNAWIGAVNSDWATPGNWNPIAAPVASLNAFIPANVTNMPVVNQLPATPAVCNNLTISNGTTVTIASGKALTVSGTLSNNSGVAGLVVESGGSLIQNSAGVEGTVKRYIANWTNAPHGWHFLSSPVQNQAIDPAFINPNLANFDFYAWWEATNEWISFNNTTTPPTWNTANVLNGISGGGNFIPGKGYLVAYLDADTKQFTGSLNKDNITVSNLGISTGINKGWHFLGNPFSCAMVWNDGSWSLTNIAGTAKIWNEAYASYSDINATSTIPSTQGFMVDVTAATGTLTIPASSRIHSTQAWYKATGNPYIKLIAHNPSVQTAQESIITFDNQSTPGYDPEFDSRFLPGYAPEFYSVDGTEHLSTNVLPDLNNQTTIPFTFIKTAESDYYIEGVQIDNFPGSVFLTDLKLNLTQNLTVNPVYNFIASDGDEPARFLLSFGMVGIGDNSGINNGIYTYENNLYIVNPGKATLELYNITGQKLLTKYIDQTGLFRTTLYVPTANYIVRLTTGTKVIVTKVFVKS